ncbi:SLC13 family permease [Ornithinimicrobium humiphilum]|uniref:UIT1 family transporter n=1 Tax=Ornithinimicrobium humiphilum TaxID=125288 RepID=A0A543KLA6_9MICO|nr:SLC13 family permease [Ornithinimicrobium humiphilum]TQM95868.1 UIT1 family transporter [Ornithinimicrobium humiphilum]
MSPEVISILGLVVVFLIATIWPVHMGALALVAAFFIGTYVAGEDGDAILGGFPADLFLILVGVTYLFALAKDNGTVDWLVHMAVKSVGGRVALIPWVFFFVTAVITAVGAVVPAAVAIIAPMGMAFARRYGIKPLLMGLMVINGATAGGFSPLSIFGSITNGVVARNDLPGSPLLLFTASLVFNIVLGIVCFVLFGGRNLLGKVDRGEGLVDSRTGESVDSVEDAPEAGGVGAGAGGPGAAPAGGGVADGPRQRDRSGRATNVAVQTTPVDSDKDDTPDESLDLPRIVTLGGILFLSVMVLGFGWDVGFTSIIVAVVISLVNPKINKGAVSKIAWPTVLLITGIVTYVELMQRMGTIDWLGNAVANFGTPLVAAIVICFIGAVVSAFASTTGILGALIPLAVPFLLAGEVGPIGMVIALAISSSVVDSSPFSTSGALVVANAPEEERDRVFKQLMIWGFSMVIIAPIVTWLIFVVPGWG